jgi:protein SSD1
MELNEGSIYTKADVISIGKEVYEVYVPALGLEKKIFIQSLPTEQHHYDKKTQTLDIFWKHGVPVSMINEEKIYAQERIRKDDYSDEEEEEEQDDLVDSFDTLSVNESSNNKELLEPSVILEPVTGLQRIRMFSNINVRIQVNMDISPPIINIYPVNPFSGETVIEQYF